jgi:hypothetical protein
MDPDASPPNLTQVRHFLDGSFYLEPGHQGVHALVNRTPALSEFLDPQPPAGSGLHRYVERGPVCCCADVGKLTYDFCGYVFLLFTEPTSFKF